MAIAEFFTQLGREKFLDPSAKKRQEAMTRYQDAGQLLASGNMPEAQNIALSARGLESEATELQDRYQRLTEVFVPAIIQQLRDEFGIEPDSLSIQIEGQEAEGRRDEPAIASNDVLSIVRREEEPGGRIGEIDRKDASVGEGIDTRGQSEDSPLADRKKFTLSLKQSLISRSIFRLIDEPRDGVSLTDAVGELYADELAEKNKRPEQLVGGRIRPTWYGSVRGKIEGVFQGIPSEGEPLKLPISDEIIDQLDFAPFTQDILKRLNKVPAYEGMTIDELLEYTRTSAPINLLKRDEALKRRGGRRRKTESRAESIEEPQTGDQPPTEPEAIDKKEPENEEIENPLSFKPAETYYIVRELVRTLGQQMVVDDRQALEIALDEFEEAGIEITDPSQIMEEVLEKLGGLEEKPEEVFDAQDSTGQLVVAMLMGKTRSEIVQLLTPGEEK